MTPRRRFLVLVAGAAAMPRLAFAQGDSAAARLIATVPDRDSAAILGRAWRARFPQEPVGAALAGEILASLPAEARAREGTALHAALRARVRADFATGEIVHLDGWRLSRTEGRLAALCADAPSVL